MRLSETDPAGSSPPRAVHPPDRASVALRQRRAGATPLKAHIATVVIRADGPACGPWGTIFADGSSFNARAIAGTVAINVLPIESYLAAVLGGEMPASFPAEALKAQAVAARSYALTRKIEAREAGSPFHLGATVPLPGVSWAWITKIHGRRRPSRRPRARCWPWE